MNIVCGTQAGSKGSETGCLSRTCKLVVITGISNEVGRCQEDASSFLASLNLFSSPSGTPVRRRSSAPTLERAFFRGQSRPCSPYSLEPMSLHQLVLPTNHLFGHGGP
jgi:hypothetical protein